MHWMLFLPNWARHDVWRDQFAKPGPRSLRADRVNFPARPGIHVFVGKWVEKAWMAGTKPGHDAIESAYGFKIDAPVVARLSRSICALAASFSA